MSYKVRCDKSYLSGRENKCYRNSKRRELPFRGALRERLMEKVIVTSWRQERTCISSRENPTEAKEKWEKANVFRRQVD